MQIDGSSVAVQIQSIERADSICQPTCHAIGVNWLPHRLEPSSGPHHFCNEKANEPELTLDSACPLLNHLICRVVPLQTCFFRGSDKDVQMHHDPCRSQVFRTQQFIHKCLGAGEINQVTIVSTRSAKSARSTASGEMFGASVDVTDASIGETVIGCKMKGTNSPRC